MANVKIKSNELVYKDGSNGFSMVFADTGDDRKATIKGSLIPDTTGADVSTGVTLWNLGSGDAPWQSIFQGEQTLYMGDNGMLTVKKGKMIIQNRKDGNLFPPPLWHQKHALYKYGIQTSVQQDEISRKTRNYIGTIQYDEKVGTFTDASPDTFTIQNTSSSAESESDDFYKDWYIQTTGTVSGSSTTIYGKITGYTASSRTLSVTNWFSDSALSTGVTVTAISTGTLFNLKSPGAHSSQTQTKLDELAVSGSIPTVTSQTQFILSASSGTLSSANDTYNKIYTLKVVNGGNTYYAKVTDWIAGTSTVKVKSSNPWYTDISLNFVASQPTIAVSDTFTLIARKIRLVDLNIENMLNILKTDVPNSQDYKKYGNFGDDLDTGTYTSFTGSGAWNDNNVYDTEGNITSSWDTTTGAYQSGTAIDIYSGSYNQGTGFSAQSIGEGSTFRSVAISQASITSDAYNTLEVILPSNDANSLSPTTDYSGYELQLKDTNGAIEYMTVVSSTSVTVSAVNHVKITVSWPFYSQPTSSHTYILKGYVDAYQEMGGDTGYSASNQSSNITSLNYQIKLESTAISEDDYYNGYKITIDVYDASNYTTTSIYGTVTDYSGSTKIINISSSTYGGGGNQWTTAGSQASVTPYTGGYDYYTLEKSGGAADYQTDYYTSGSISYDPMKTFQDASYGNLSAATSAGMDTELYKFMEHIQADTDALNFDQFDASQAVAYNWSDYFFESKDWYGSTNAMYTDETCIVGTSTPPSGSLYCKLSVYGSIKSRALLAVPSDTSSNNIKKITKDYKNKGYIFSQGLYIANQDLSSIALRSNDISLSDGGLIVKGSTSLEGGASIGTLQLASGSITDSSGAISFGNENLTTTGTSTASQFNMNSDKRLKKNIQELDEEHESLLNLNPVAFDWKEDFVNDKNRHYGFIAQEVKKIYPNLVQESECYTKGSRLTINYVEIIPLLVSHIQKQDKVLQTILKKLHLTIE
jgi:hypothetical protein